MSEKGDEAQLSRRGLIKTGTAAAAGAGVAGLAGASSAQADSGPTQSFPTKRVKIDFDGTQAELRNEILRTARKPDQALKLQILESALANVVLSNASVESARRRKFGLTLGFSLVIES